MTVPLLIIIHCTHYNASRMVFLMCLLRMYCRFSAVLIVWDAGSTLGWGVFCCDRFKGAGKGGGRFYGWSGFSKASKILLGYIVCLGGCFSKFCTRVVSLNGIEVCPFAVAL